MPTADGRVIALGPDSGKPCTAFGGGKGQIDLWAGMPNPQARRLLFDLARGGELRASSSSAAPCSTTCRPKSSPASYALSTSTPAPWSGPGIRAGPTAARRSSPAKAIPPIRPTAGRFPASTKRWAWSTCPGQPAARPVGRQPQSRGRSGSSSSSSLSAQVISRNSRMCTGDWAHHSRNAALSSGRPRLQLLEPLRGVYGLQVLDLSF